MNKIKISYTFTLILLVGLMVLTVQTTYVKGLTTPEVDAQRIDTTNENFGDYSKLIVKINNPHDFNHNYTFLYYKNSMLRREYELEIRPDKPFTLSTIISQNTPLGTIHNVTFIIYRDDLADPIENIEYIFN